MEDSELNAIVLICGAGIAGVSAAYHLSVRQKTSGVILVDDQPPLSLTSDHSTECYRNWWPGPGDAMVRLMNRSIDLLEELAAASGNIFHMNRRGYLYVTGDPQQASQMEESAIQISSLGGGPLRVHRGRPSDPVYQPSPASDFANVPDGADLLLGSEVVHNHFPYLSTLACAALHVRRAGWLSAQQLGQYLLDQARVHGTRLVNDRITGFEIEGGRVTGAKLSSGKFIHVENVVLANGPFLEEACSMLNLTLPVYNELHLKLAMKDPSLVVPRSAPLLIWTDPQYLDWTEEERAMLAEDPDIAWLLGEMPAGVHTRPEGADEGQMILALWEYHVEEAKLTWPVPLDPDYPELAVRGLARLLPGMQAYIGRMSKPRLDGGYYTKTRENRPLIGPLPVRGAYVIGALSGFGIMAACAAGELLAAHVSGAALPNYAGMFSPERYNDPAYLAMLKTWGDSGQL